LAGLAGFFIDAARQPPPVGLPTLRAFQRAQGQAVLSWLREELSTGSVNLHADATRLASE
jgi:hypothetical protein